MTERGLPSADSAPACPFVAFEDDREARSTSPDHRHRCYAELVPSPRAAAHQEAYCLSSAFPVCPTFQDWARREAAHARGEGERPRAAPAAVPDVGAPSDPHAADHDKEDQPSRQDRGVVDDGPTRRNPPRDWAAPPPWASPGAVGAPRHSTSGSGGDASHDAGAPDFVARLAADSQGLAGSAADRLAAGGGVAESGAKQAASPFDAGAAAAPDEELAGLVAGRRTVERPAHDYFPSRSTRRPSVSSTRTPRRERERDRDAIVGPSWESARRYEAYPTIRTRAGLPSLPRLAVLAVALAVAAVALFFLPAILGVGGGGGDDTSTPNPSGSQGASTASLEPTAPAAPTPQVYVIKSGDTLSEIAKSFGLTVEELLAANKDTIPDPDKIVAGDEIVIPAKPPDEFTEPSAGSSP